MMKKIVFLTLFMATILQNGQSQVSIGGMVGVNYSDLTITNEDPEYDFVPSPKNGIGYFIGGNISLPMGNKFNFLADLKYVGRGFRDRYPTYLNKFIAHYFDLAPKVEFRPNENFGIALGVNYGIHLGGGGFKDTNPDWKNFAYSGSMRRYFNNFFVEAGYEHGMERLSNFNIIDDEDESISDFKMHFNTFILGVGYLIEP